MNCMRVIPTLLLKGQGLVKTVEFANPQYVGDPINAVRIFNEKEVDEVSILDILASRESREPNFSLLAQIAEEAFMPLSYGGGITKVEHAREIFRIGFEKIVLNTMAFENPDLVRKIAQKWGRQSVVVSIDVRKSFWGSYRVFVRGRTKNTGEDPVAFAKKVEEYGAGEILLNSIDRDGTQSGFAIDVIKAVSSAVRIPTIALGGAGTLDDFRKAFRDGGASAVAAGSFFVFHGKHRAVLITYPTPGEIKNLQRQGAE